MTLLSNPKLFCSHGGLFGSKFLLDPSGQGPCCCGPCPGWFWKGFPSWLGFRLLGPPQFGSGRFGPNGFTFGLFCWGGNGKPGSCCRGKASGIPEGRFWQATKFSKVRSARRNAEMNILKAYLQKRKRKSVLTIPILKWAAGQPTFRQRLAS